METGPVDPADPADSADSVDRPGAQVWLALGFLTVLPVPAVVYTPQAFGRAGVWFPWVGLLVGGLLWAAWLAASALLLPWLAAVLVVALWAALTGALHLDGLADCCDGLLPPVPPARRLEIMHDARVGAFGVVGLVLFLAAKIGAVAELAQLGRLEAGAVLILAAVWARWLLLWAARGPQARAEGLGAGFARALTPRVVALAGVLPLLCLGLAAAAWESVLVPLVPFAAAVGASGCAVAVVAFARARIGGVTGDVLGLVVELCELTVLLVCAALL